MRLALILWSASASAAIATPTDAYHRLWDPYAAILSRTCPAKHLDLTSPAELNSMLEDYKTRLPAKIQREMASAENRHCRGSVAGLSCMNMGDIEVTERRRLLPQLARSICQSPVKCWHQSDCDGLTPLLMTFPGKSGAFAQPLGDPAEWVKIGDYPPVALLEKEQGTTGYRIEVDGAGRPMSCKVTASSGSHDLDDTTCALVMRRARFSAGAPGSSVSSQFEWKIRPVR